MAPEPLKHGPGEISTLLVRLQDGDRTVEDQLFAAVHSELRKIARRYMRDERPGHTLQATALVNEAYVKLVKQRRPDWKNRAHFFAIASRVMRRILVDHAKARLAGKRWGGNRPLSLDEELLIPDERCQQLSDLDDSLRLLERGNPRAGRVVELVADPDAIAGHGRRESSLDARDAGDRAAARDAGLAELARGAGQSLRVAAVAPSAH